MAPTDDCAPARAHASPHQGIPPADTVPSGVRRSSRYFPEVESLRGIAILLVVLHHANGWMTPGGGDGPGSVVSPWWAFIAGGQTGVSLFFVLSGFLLSLPFLAEARGGPHVRRADYYRRRAYRILPLYYVAVAVGTVLSAHQWTDLGRGLPYLLFLNAFPLVTPLKPYSSVWWSLATEVHFYLVLPLVPYFLTSRTGRWAGALILVGYGLLLCLLLTGYVAITLPWAIALTHSLLGRGYMFLLGGAAAAIYLRYGPRPAARGTRTRSLERGWADVALALVVIALALLLRWQVHAGYWNIECTPWHAWHLAEAFLWTTILVVVLLAPLRTKALFCNRWLGRLGVLSYSIYLVHLPLIQFSFVWLRDWWPLTFTAGTLPTKVAVGAMVGACVAVSELTYRVIEEPFLRRKARIE